MPLLVISMNSNCSQICLETLGDEEEDDEVNEEGSSGDDDEEDEEEDEETFKGLKGLPKLPGMVFIFANHFLQQEKWEEFRNPDNLPLFHNNYENVASVNSKTSDLHSYAIICCLSWSSHSFTL